MTKITMLDILTNPFVVHVEKEHCPAREGMVERQIELSTGWGGDTGKMREIDGEQRDEKGDRANIYKVAYLRIKP